MSQPASERRRDTPPDSAVTGRSWLVWALLFAGALIGGYAALSLLDRPAFAAPPAGSELVDAQRTAASHPVLPAAHRPVLPAVQHATVLATKTDRTLHTGRTVRAVTDSVASATAPVPVVGAVVAETSKSVVTPVLDVVSPVLDKTDEAVEETGLPELITEVPGRLDPRPPTVPLPTVPLPTDVPPVATPAQPVPSQVDAPPPPRAALRPAPPVAAPAPVPSGPTFLSGTSGSSAAAPARHVSAAGAPVPGTPPAAPTDPLAPDAVCQPAPRGPAGGDQLASAAPDAAWTPRLIGRAAGSLDDRPHAQRALGPLRRPG